VPRESMHLIGDPASPHIVTVRTGVDHTEGMIKWAGDKLKQLEKDCLKLSSNITKVIYL
jgi:hypothetical protein